MPPTSQAAQAAHARGDSVRAHREARSAQVAFELRRRRLLPVVSGGSRGRCDVRLGRFCYWHDDDESTPPPAEPLPIADARAQLTDRLAQLADAVPGDAWIAGQRVRYLVEAKRFADAVEVAGRCRGGDGWCRALEGFALHAAGDAGGADSAFALALAAMPGDERCAWEDVAFLLPSRAASRYQRLACAERRAVADTLWWLAHPRWSGRGNDRRAEHHARHVMSRLERESRSPYDMSWGKDTHELIVRYGWPTAWSRDVGSIRDMSAIHVIGHEPHPAFDFLPGDSALAAPAHAPLDGWRFRNADAISRYAPRQARAFVLLDPQVARFPRGDSVLVVAVAHVAGDSVLQGESLEGALAISASPYAPVAVADAAVGGGRAIARLTRTNEAAVASVELRDTVARQAGRARQGLPPLAAADTQGTLLSDLLLYIDPSPDDATLDAVIPRALGRLRMQRGERVGAYWELARRAPTRDSVTYVLTVTPRDAGWLRRVARRVGVAAAAAPVHIRFTEPIDDSPTTARALAFDLSHLVPGRYEVRLRAEVTGGAWGESARELRVVAR